MAKPKKRPAGQQRATIRVDAETKAAKAAERERRVAQREAAQQKADRARRRRRLLRLSLVVTLVIVLVGALAGRIVLKRRAIDRIVARSAAAAEKASCGSIKHPSSAGRKHISPSDAGAGYTSDPPTSGPHFTNTAGTGVGDRALPDGQLIHNLEHGGVVIQHNGLADEQLQSLKDAVQGLDDAKVLLVPDPTLPNSVHVAYTAWRRLQTCAAFDEKVLDSFLDLYLAPGGKDVGAPEKDQPL